MNDQPADDAAIAFLASEYEQVVARDAVLLQTIFTVVGIAVTVLGGIALGVPSYDPHGEGVAKNKELFLALPLAPTIVFGLLCFLTFHINFTAQYSHALEAHMAKLGGRRLSAGELRVPALSTESPSMLRLESRVFGAGRSTATALYTSALGAVLLAVGSLLVVVPVIKLRGLPVNYQIAAAVIFLPPNVLLLTALLRSWRPNRQLLRDTLIDIAGVRRGATQRGRRLWSYVLVPRTVDHLVKVLIAIVGTFLGRLALHHQDGAELWGWETLGAVALVVVVLEYLLYQSRYTWNDLRDLRHDRKHARSEERRRIAVPISRTALRTVWLSIPLKHLVAFSLVWRLAPQHLLRFTLGAVGVWLSALVYEGLRGASRRRLGVDGERGEMSSDTNDKPDVFDTGVTRLSLAICLIVGGGYAVRIATALEVGGDGIVPLGVVVLLAATMWLSEVSTVAMSWTLEGTELVHGPPDRVSESGRNLLRAPYRDPLLRTKAHIAFLLRSTGLIDERTPEQDPPPRVDLNRVPDPKAECNRCHRRGSSCPRLVRRVRRERATEEAAQLQRYQRQGFLVEHGTWCSLWSVSGAASFLLAALSAITASAGLAIPDANTTGLAAVVALPAAAQAMWTKAAHIPWGFGTSAIALGIIAWRANLPYAVLAPALFGTLAAVFHATRLNSYQLVVGWIDGIAGLVGRLSASVWCLSWTTARWIAGGGTWAMLDDDVRREPAKQPANVPFARWEEPPERRES